MKIFTDKHSRRKHPEFSYVNLLQFMFFWWESTYEMKHMGIFCLRHERFIKIITTKKMRSRWKKKGRGCKKTSLRLLHNHFLFRQILKKSSYTFITHASLFIFWTQIFGGFTFIYFFSFYPAYPPMVFFPFKIKIGSKNARREYLIFVMMTSSTYAHTWCKRVWFFSSSIFVAGNVLKTVMFTKFRLLNKQLFFQWL